MTIDELAALIEETGKHHHQAYADSDGVDPEWPIWYAGYLQSHMWDRAGTLPTRSQLVHLLLRGEAEVAEVAESTTDTPWATYYATIILESLNSA